MGTEEERAKRLMAMGQMAASLAHEIRNPLGSMELFCTLLKKDLADSPGSLKLAENIHAGIKILDRIISNCLQFSRDIIPRPQPISDPRSIIERTVDYARQKLEACGVEVEITERGALPVLADAFLVQQALLNVVLNAADAAAEGASGSPRIHILSDCLLPDLWRISVTDNGPGIAEDQRERIFDPFVTTKAEGTGLGLAVVHSIVSAHQGAVQIESDVGRGSTVTLTFAACREPAARAMRRDDIGEPRYAG